MHVCSNRNTFDFLVLSVLFEYKGFRDTIKIDKIDR